MTPGTIGAGMAIMSGEVERVSIARFRGRLGLDGVVSGWVDLHTMGGRMWQIGLDSEPVFVVLDETCRFGAQRLTGPIPWRP